MSKIEGLERWFSVECIPKFGSQKSHWAAYNCIWLLASLGTCIYVHIPTYRHTQRHTIKQMWLIFIFCKYKIKMGPMETWSPDTRRLSISWGTCITRQYIKKPVMRQSTTQMRTTFQLSLRNFLTATISLSYQLSTWRKATKGSKSQVI